ncbi:MAG TPA: alpha/beta fold hydrolase [Gemmatimonadales bacterium]|nr:alpha/beta fold hydrolase [Gemmatimonadales bacterium]
MKRAALFLLLITGQAYGQTPGRRDNPEPAEREGFVAAGRGVRLFYRSVGTGRDTVIVLHGGPGFTMDYLAEDLKPLAADHTLLFYDQRGAGRSSLVTDSAALDGQRFAEDLESLRKHFRLERVTLLGHSWGAGVAALYSARYPDRISRLLIVDGIPLRRQELVSASQNLSARRDSASRAQMEKWMEARRADPGDARACRAYYVIWFAPFFPDTTALRRSRGDFCAGTPESRRNKITSVDRYVLASLGEWDWRPALHRVRRPALVIHGEADPLPVASAREWVAALPNAKLLLLRQVGHFPYLEQPEVFFAAVRTFLRGAWPKGAE